MSQTDKMVELISKRKNRSITRILQVKERQADRHLPPAVAGALRQAVLDELNNFADFATDLVRALETDEVVVNEHYLEKIDEIHDIVVGNGPPEGNGKTHFISAT